VADGDQISVLAAVKAYVAGVKRTPPPRHIGVLVVDDEEPVRKFVERVLHEAGYATAVAADGAEAIQVAATLDPFDLVVTDVMMPRMSGDELARRLRASRPSLKVLYLTGFSDRLFKDKVTLWEDEAFLDKPCSVNGLLQAVSLLTLGRVNAPGESRP
jgi:CheY-like chemotaxis protein